MSAQPEQGTDLHPADHGGRKAVIWIVGSLVLLAALGGGAWYLSTIPDIGSTIGAILLTVFGAVAYVIPSIIAIRRKHHSMGAIIAVNLLLGWSLIGWIIALVWSGTWSTATASTGKTGCHCSDSLQAATVKLCCHSSCVSPSRVRRHS